jgi:hypothetical protein
MNCKYPKHLCEKCGKELFVSNHTISVQQHPLITEEVFRVIPCAECTPFYVGKQPTEQDGDVTISLSEAEARWLLNGLDSYNPNYRGTLIGVKLIRALGLDKKP